MSFNSLLCFLSSLLSKSHWTESIWVAERFDPSGLVLSDWAALKPQTVCLLRLQKLAPPLVFFSSIYFAFFPFLWSLYIAFASILAWVFFVCLFILLGVTCSKGEGGKEYKKKGRMAGNILAFLYKNITRQRTLHREWEKGRGCQQTLILLLSYWPFRLGYCENKATGNLYSHRTRAWSLLLFILSRVFLLKFSFVGNNR